MDGPSWATGTLLESPLDGGAEGRRAPSAGASNKLAKKEKEPWRRSLRQKRRRIETVIGQLVER